jgi:hypothetical protein
MKKLLATYETGKPTIAMQSTSIQGRLRRREKAPNERGAIAKTTPRIAAIGPGMTIGQALPPWGPEAIHDRTEDEQVRRRYRNSRHGEWAFKT